MDDEVINPTAAREELVNFVRTLVATKPRLMAPDLYELDQRIKEYGRILQKMVARDALEALQEEFNDVLTSKPGE